MFPSVPPCYILPMFARRCDWTSGTGAQKLWDLLSSNDFLGSKTCSSTQVLMVACYLKPVFCDVLLGFSGWKMLNLTRRAPGLQAGCALAHGISSGGWVAAQFFGSLAECKMMNWQSIGYWMDIYIIFTYLQNILSQSFINNSPGSHLGVFLKRGIPKCHEHLQQ